MSQGERPARPPTRILPLAHTLHIIGKICDAMIHAHEHRIFHRDLKPSNIILRRTGDPVVTDFGLAKLSQEDLEISLSMTGYVMGTIDYMAPEQSRDAKHIDARADIYSLGAILYEMLTGRRHFESTGDFGSDLHRLRHHDPPTPRSLNPKIDQKLETIVLKALRPDRAGRYPTMQAFKDDLQNYSLGRTISARPESAADILKKLVKRNPTMSCTLGGGFLLATVALLGFMFLLNRGRIEAEHQRDLAESARKQSEEATRLAESQRAWAESERDRALKAEEETLSKSKELAKAMKEIRHQEGVIARSEGERAFLQAKDAVEKNDLTRARDLLAQALEKEPRLSEAWRLKAQLDLVRLNLTAAIQAYAQTAQLDPQSRQPVGRIIQILRRYSTEIAPNSEGFYPPFPIMRLARDLRGTEEYPLFMREQQSAQVTMAALLKQKLCAFNRLPPRTAEHITIQVADDEVEITVEDERQITQLSPLRGFAYFTSARLLRIGTETLEDLAPSPLRELEIRDTPIRDLSPLRHTRIESLTLDQCPITTLTPLEKAPLKKLRLKKITLRNPAELSAWPLESLALTEMPCDPKLLAKLPLQELELHSAPIERLPLLPPQLVSLSATASPLRDITELKNHFFLKRLSLADTRVSDITPLAKLSLEHLDLSRSRVTQLDALTSLPLKELHLDGLHLLDLAPLQGKKIESITISPDRILHGTEVLRDMGSLRRIRAIYRNPEGEIISDKEYEGGKAARLFYSDYAAWRGKGNNP